MMLKRAAILSVIAGLACGGGSGARAEQPRDARYDAIEARVPNLTRRLEALSPADPGAYFALGEEVAQEASELIGKRLATELFVLTLALDRRGSVAPPSAFLADKPSLGSSACLALAGLADNEQQRRWLTAMAATLGGDAAVDPAPSQSTQASRDPAALELATVLGWVRAGEGRRAAKLLEKPGVNALLDKCDKLLNPGIGGGAERVRRQVDQYALCSQCRNRRYVKGPEGVTLCPSCRGTPGIKLSAREVVDQLRVESALLSGVQRSWAAQSVADAGEPLRDLDPAEIASIFHVDPAKTLWRDGRWVVDPNAVAPVPADAPADPANPPATQPPTGESSVTGTGRAPASMTPRP